MQIALAVLFAFILAATPAYSAPKISIIHSYHNEYAWEQGVNRGLVEALPRDAVLEHFYMDTKRIPLVDHALQADKAFEYLTKADPDLIVLCDDAAAKHLGPRLKDGSTPVVFLGINRNPRDYGIFPAKNITGVLERPLLIRSLHSMCSLINPSHTKVLILFDSDTTSDAVVHEAFHEKPSLSLGKVHVDLKQFGQAKEWQAALRNAKADGYDTVYVGLYHTLRDNSGKHVPDEEILAWANANTPVPIFGFWDFAVGRNKAIGGHVLSSRDQGFAAGRIVCQILDGTPPSAIPPQTAETGLYMFSSSELKRFGIELSPAIREQAVLVP